MEWGAVTHIGKIRDNNEDSYYIDRNYEQFFIVADGMGGHNAGEIASKMAIDVASSVFNKYLHNNFILENFSTDIIKQAVSEANEKIYEQSLLNNDCDGMGTTLTISLFLNGKVYIGHIGDSRAYLLKNDNIIQLTQDHTLVSELLKNGSITEIEAKSHPKRNIITKALGTESNIEADIFEYTIEDDNIIILCTDGLTNAVSNEEIKSYFINSKNVQETCNELVDLANLRGGYDNITILAIRYRYS